MKNGVRLRKLVEETQESRIARSAHNIFKHGYSPVTHARFRRRVLRSWMKRQSEQSLALAKFYWGVLRGVPDEQTTRLRSYGPDNRG